MGAEVSSFRFWAYRVAQLRLVCWIGAACLPAIGEREREKEFPEVDSVVTQIKQQSESLAWKFLKHSTSLPA